MKKLVLFSMIISFLTVNAYGQAKTSKKKKVAKKTAVTKRETTAVNDTATVVLTNTGHYNAYAPSTATGSFRITDPTINLLNQRAAGADIPMSTTEIVRMPKGTYGFANGRILLRSTTASSPGTGYGSGAVGTGTSILSMGTSESSIGVNGKSPYAGTWLWGDRRPVYNLSVQTQTQNQQQ